MNKIEYLLFLSNKIDTASSYQQIPLSTKDNVFAADDELGNDEQNGDNVVINAEDIEFGDDDARNDANETTNVDQGSLKKIISLYGIALY